MKGLESQVNCLDFLPVLVIVEPVKHTLNVLEKRAAGMLQFYHAFVHLSAPLHCMNEVYCTNSMFWIITSVLSLKFLSFLTATMLSAAKGDLVTLSSSKSFLSWADLGLFFPWRCPANCYHTWLVYWLRMKSRVKYLPFRFIFAECCLLVNCPFFVLWMDLRIEVLTLPSVVKGSVTIKQ